MRNGAHRTAAIFNEAQFRPKRLHSNIALKMYLTPRAVCSLGLLASWVKTKNGSFAFKTRSSAPLMTDRGRR